MSSTTVQVVTANQASNEGPGSIEPAKKNRTRRGWSLVEHRVSTESFYDADEARPAASGAVDVQDSIPENSVLSTVASTIPRQLLTRSPKPPPRRSQSVTDKEPESSPGTPQPSERLGIADLPPELHMAILDFLDPIDGVCLGLTCLTLYKANRRKNPRVLLSSHYTRPNNLEWAWRGQHSSAAAVAALIHPAGLPQAVATSLRVSGQVYCRKCGTERCQLYRHIKGWMGDGYEYCQIREKYGKPAEEGARPHCYRASPKHGLRCGRHRDRGSVSTTISG